MFSWEFRDDQIQLELAHDKVFLVGFIENGGWNLTGKGISL